ncbi:phospholipase D-like domain-containing protein [Patescibacteria group bacterium]
MRKKTLLGGLGYGLGFFVSTAFASLILRSFIASRLELIIESQQPLVRLLLAVFFILIVFFISGGIAGWIGSSIMVRLHKFKSENILIRNISLALGTAHALVIIPLLFVTSIITFYNDGTDLRISRFLLLFGLYGVVYGSFSGIFLAVLSKGYRMRAWLAAFAGFTLGGGGFGLTVWGFLTYFDKVLTRSVVWSGFTAAGFIAGSILSLVYFNMDSKVPEKLTRVDRKYLPKKLKVILGAGLLLIISFTLLNFMRKIVVRSGHHSPTVASSATGVVYGEDDDVLELSEYECDEGSLNEIERAVYDVVNSEKYNPKGDIVPFCNNEYVKLFFTPNPEENYSDESIQENGAYDEVANMALSAKYEVLFSTMQWDKNTSDYNPGAVFAKAISDLYQKVKNNPDQYPEGMSIKILTGNIPVMATFEIGNHSWHVIEDLRNAGLPETKNEKMGWQVEVADFKGAWPHSHSKFVVIDGRSVMAAGFNYSYLHFPTHHVSGKGIDKVDLGMQLTGPVAQLALSTFDDLWVGSTQKVCSDLHPKVDFLWTLKCKDIAAKISHPASSLNYYLSDDNTSNAFSLYRNENHSLADDAIVAALSNAKEKIDVFEVNFSLELVCYLAIIYEGVCDYDNNSLPYMKAIMHAVEGNRVPIRIIIEKSNMNGLENKVSIKEFYDALRTRGLEDLVEIKYHSGNMHAKAFNVDDKFLVVGSHNFQYSAWGEGGGLTEYSLGTNDQEAISDFSRLFEHEWERGNPVDH